MRYFPKSKYWVAIITLVLFIIPFFWLKPNEIDIGGDSTRLYFYDPLNFLLNNSLYLTETIGLGSRSFWPQFYFLPYASLLLVIKSVINSPYFLISLFNGIKVSISFLSIYLIIRTILQNSYREKSELQLQLPALLGGLLYATAPIVIGNYDKALISQDQIFLYPLCFYFILCYFTNQKFRYLLIFLIITLFFATNFSWASAPPFFAFFPLSFLFLILYAIFILKKKLLYRHLFTAFFLFIGLHSFHLFSEIYSLLSPNNYVNQRVFSHSAISDDLNYFAELLSLSKLSANFLLYASFKQFVLFFIIPPFFLFLGLCFNKGKDRTLFLIGAFFLITLYLVTANITQIGVTLYTFFFYLPGFSMFRNFIGQWAFVYSFFYALLFGIGVYFLFKKVSNTKVLVILTACISLSLIMTSWNFFIGDAVNADLDQSNVKIPMVMDPHYEETLNYIRSLKNEGAFISFPFSDCCYTVVHGFNNGAYVGPSPISTLTGELDYDGYQRIDPFGETFFRLVKTKNYEGIKKLFGILNIKYIYYNDDPKAYNAAYFPAYPYSSAKVVFPQSQKGYKEFMKNIMGKEIYHNGTYHIYETDKKYFHPLFYTTGTLKIYKTPQTEMYIQTEPFFDFSPQTKDTYVDNLTCLQKLPKSYCSQNGKQFNKLPKIQYQEINPTLYQIHVTNAKSGYLLIFSKSFDKDWNISLSKGNNLEDLWAPKNLPVGHIMVNGYSNAWYILPKDVGNKSDYTLTIQLNGQKVFYIGASISVLTLLIMICWGIFFLFRR